MSQNCTCFPLTGHTTGSTPDQDHKPSQWSHPEGRGIWTSVLWISLKQRPQARHFVKVCLSHYQLKYTLILMNYFSIYICSINEKHSITTLHNLSNQFFSKLMLLGFICNTIQGNVQYFQSHKPVWEREMIHYSMRQDWNQQFSHIRYCLLLVLTQKMAWSQ